MMVYPLSIFRLVLVSAVLSLCAVGAFQNQVTSRANPSTCSNHQGTERATCTKNSGRWFISTVGLCAENRFGASIETDTNQEIDRLRKQAQKLRDEIAQAEEKVGRDVVSQTELDSKSKFDSADTAKAQASTTSPWSLSLSKSGSEREQVSGAYRLYVDIGREPGTWMDPRWGASDRRLEFTIDVQFTSVAASRDTQNDMVKDNLGGSSQSSPVYELKTASLARLRQGFDQMPCSKGGYRLDGAGNKSQQTVRFFLRTEGKQDGDLSIEPNAPLYFSLPAFGNNLSNLSRKEGIVSVRQMGWHTGWYREESRIVGVFRAVPLDEAQRRDGF